MKPPFFRFFALFLSALLLFGISVFALVQKTDVGSAVIVADDLPSVKEGDEIFTVILDPGHGGEDGGAQGLYHTCEKELNLRLALKTAALLRENGYKVTLTREEDVMLGDGKKGAKKLSDLRARVDIANNCPNALLISIHMNKFPQSSCRGVQIFYSGNDPKSVVYARCLEKLLKENWSDTRTRELKKATSAIYLLDRVRIPAVLIECGFLSNEEDASALLTDAYQERFAELILCALNDYAEEIGDRPPTPSA